jgi:hypothetical protein
MAIGTHWETIKAVFKEGRKLLRSHFSSVRDITFDSFEPVDVGKMTDDLWQ